MALIKCPECGKDVSDKSPACIHCGYPMELLVAEKPVTEIVEQIALQEDLVVPELDEKGPARKPKKVLLLGLVLLVVGLLSAYKPILYSVATIQMNSEKYEAAAVLFGCVGDYSDALNLYDECQMHVYADYDFLETLGESILKRRELNDDNTDYKTLTKTELAYLENYKYKDFYDAGLKRVAVAYINGLYMQQEALKLEHIEYLIKWEEGALKRYKALETLYKEYDFLSNDKEFVATYVGESATLQNEISALKLIKQDLESQLWGITLTYVNSTTQSAKYKNNTKNDFNLFLYVDYYDKKDQKIETNYFYYDNILPNTTRTLKINWPKSAETCHFDFEIDLIE